MPRISVIIPSYNHERFVAEAIQSVLDQTYQDFEIIITDDGSHDNSVEIIRNFSDPRIKLFCFDKNQGACNSVKNCIENSEGEFVAMLSSDDVFLADKLEKQINFLDAHPDIAAVFGYAEFIDENSFPFDSSQHHYNQVFMKDNRDRWSWLRYFFFAGNCLCHPSMLIRSHCYQHIGLYDPRYRQLPDFDFWTRLCMEYEIYILPEFLIQFRILENERNVSGKNPDTQARSAFELPLILKNYLGELAQKQFTSIFPCRFQPEADLIPFHIAMMALWFSKPSWNNSVYYVFAVNSLFEFLHQNPDVIEKLEQHYEFSYASLTKLSGLNSRQTFAKELDIWFQKTPIDIDEIFQSKRKSEFSFRSTIIPLNESIASRPFWSVMIPVYNPKSHYLQEAVESVLTQFQSYDNVQIEIVDDCSPDVDVKKIIEDRGWRNVSFYRQPHNLGLIGNWNSCIERSSGQWIHIFHQDDKVLSGFYESLYRPLSQINNQSIGAAFCRHFFMDQNSQHISVSGLEHPSPGILDNWVQEIAIYQRIQFASIVVNRQVYEKLGGFNPAAESAADWEMWKRIAAFFPVWYEPEPLACYRLHDSSESSQLINTGKNIADTLKSILISQEYLPSDSADYLSELAKEHYAIYALNSARQMLASGLHSSAFSQIREGLRCSQSSQVMHYLSQIFSQSTSDSSAVSSNSDWLERVSTAIQQYQKQPAHPGANASLKRIRQQFSDYLLNLDITELESSFQGSSEKAFKMLVEIGVSNLSINSEGI